MKTDDDDAVEEKIASDEEFGHRDVHDVLDSLSDWPDSSDLSDF